MKWNNVLSYIFQLNFGVKQKSVLSPALFAVYLDDLSNLFILERHKLVILYADDILIIALPLPVWNGCYMPVSANFIG